MNSYTDPLAEINQRLTAAKEHLLDIIEAAQALEQAGMYPAVPNGRWETRNGSTKYLTLYFPKDDAGKYTSPDRKRKLYVGNDPAKVAEADRLTTNRKRYDALKATEKNLEWHIRDLENALSHHARSVKLYPRCNLAEFAPATIGDTGPGVAGISNPQTITS